MAPDNYDNYEAELVDLEQREMIHWRVPTDIEKKTFQAAARKTLEHNRSIQIQLSEQDLTILEKQAHGYGISCQALIGSIVHRYVSGKWNQPILES